MCRSRRLLPSAVLLLALDSAAAPYPEFEGERLALGRAVWLENCEGCHAYGIAGAPLAGA